jgi:hypothetical protein
MVEPGQNSDLSHSWLGVLSIGFGVELGLRSVGRCGYLLLSAASFRHSAALFIH